MTTLLLFLACAARGPSVEWALADALPPPALAELFAAQPADQLFDEAVARRQDGDIDGAIARLAWLRDHGESSPAVLYQLGVAYELNEQFETAIAVYETLLDEHPGEFVLDAGFRRGLCLEELGYYEAAYRQFRKIPDGIAFDRHDRYTLDIAIGIAALRAGHEAKGLQLLETALMAVEGTGEVTWIAAKGWYTLADYSLERSNQISLDVKEKKQVQRLGQRAAYIAEAEERLVKVIKLEEPEWIMAGLLSLGDAYMDLHADLVGAPHPRNLDDEQVTIYQDAVRQQASVLLTKAWAAYDQGLVVAGRFGVENRYTEQLTAARDAVPIP